MTDQQTSRTNITEALLHRAYHHLHICTDGDRELSDDIARALAAEPRSDAVTAPDEPHRFSPTRWNDADKDAAARLIVDGEARAASASVPPFGASKANPFTKKIDVVADTPEQGK